MDKRSLSIFIKTFKEWFFEVKTIDSQTKSVWKRYFNLAVIINCREVYILASIGFTLI